MPTILRQANVTGLSTSRRGLPPGSPDCRLRVRHDLEKDNTMSLLPSGGTVLGASAPAQHLAFSSFRPAGRKLKAKVVGLPMPRRTPSTRPAAAEFVDAQKGGRGCAALAFIPDTTASADTAQGMCSPKAFYWDSTRSALSPALHDASSGSRPRRSPGYSSGDGIIESREGRRDHEEAASSSSCRTTRSPDMFAKNGKSRDDGTGWCTRGTF